MNFKRKKPSKRKYRYIRRGCSGDSERDRRLYIEREWRQDWRDKINILKSEFGKEIRVDLIIKNIDGTDFSYQENILKVDDYITEKYTKDELKGLIII